MIKAMFLSLAILPTAVIAQTPAIYDTLEIRKICWQQNKGNMPAFVSCINRMAKENDALQAADDLANLRANDARMLSKSKCWRPDISSVDIEACERHLPSDDLDVEFHIFDQASQANWALHEFTDLISTIIRERQDAERAQTERERIALQKVELEAVQKRIYEEQAKANKIQAEKKRACGNDYHAIHVGMRFDRAQRCNEQFFRISEVMQADGVLSAYRVSTGGTAYVKGNVIIMWTAY